MEKHVINGITYEFNNEVRKNPAVKASFNELTQLVYDFDFEPWSNAGYWDDNYRPLVLLHANRVIAAAAANTIRFRFDDKLRNYIQIGTVMTHPDYRGRGLSRGLLERILADWRDRCDGMYLYANDTVLDYYPKFGFIRADEYKYACPVPMPDDKVRARKLNMDCERDRELLLKTYACGNPYSRLAMENNGALVMFCCMSEMRNNVWYLDEYQTAVIADFAEVTLLCDDIFGKGAVPMDKILAALVTDRERRVVLGFTPVDQTGCKASLLKAANATFFILKGKENLFEDNKLMLPLLSHA